jgi:hypothetical protein
VAHQSIRSDSPAGLKYDGGRELIAAKMKAIPQGSTRFYQVLPSRTL